MPSIAIVGGGIIGLVTSFLLRQELPLVDITLIADRLSPNTTSDGAAGAWGPFPLGNTPVEDLMRWAEFSYQTTESLPNAYIRGITPLTMTCVSDEIYPWLLQWQPILRGYTELDNTTLQELSISYGKQYKIGFNFSTYTTESSKLLPFLLEEFLRNGGVLEERNISTLSELAVNYDVIVNSPGLNAKFLVPDEEMKPMRGQLVRVYAPWIKNSILDYSAGGHFVIPNQDTVVLGGTNEESWDTTINTNDTDTIVAACVNMIPSLNQATIARAWVGLRPSRSTVRLERETRIAEDGTQYEIVHNYGHGGAGITLSWGSAKEAVDMVKQILQEKGLQSVK